MPKTLSYTYDESKTPAINFRNLYKDIIEKFNLNYYDVIEFTMDKVTYNCSTSFALNKVREKTQPGYNYHKIIKPKKTWINIIHTSFLLTAANKYNGLILTTL